MSEEYMKGFFNYFQLTALLFFLVILVGRTVHLWLWRGVRPFALGVGKRGISRALEMGFFPGLLIWIGEVFLSSIPTSIRLFPSALEASIIDSAPARVIGAFMVTVGMILFIWALRSFGDSWRVGIDKQTPGHLVTTGAFAFSRNPIFLFVDFYFIGTFLINGTIAFLLMSVVVVLGIHYQIVHEEKHLVRTYGRAYEAYRAKTGRYVTLRRRTG